MRSPSTVAEIITAAGPATVRQRGEGPAVLYSHGGQGSYLDEGLDEVAGDLDLRLVVPSRPGYRGTPLNRHTQPHQVADHFVALLDALAIDTVVVVGVSLGGRPAIELAARHPDRVRALLLCSAISGQWMEPDGPEYRQSKTLFAPSRERYIWAFTRMAFRLAPTHMAKVALTQLSTADRDPTTAECQELRDRFGQLRSFSGFVTDLDHELRPSALSQVSCPTLVQHSLNDGSVPMDHATRSHETIAASELRTYDNDWGHFLWAGPGAEAARRDARAFIASHSRRRRTPTPGT